MFHSTLESGTAVVAPKDYSLLLHVGHSSYGQMKLHREQ